MPCCRRHVSTSPCGKNKRLRDALCMYVFKLTLFLTQGYSEFRSCVKEEVEVPNRRYGLCGRKTTLKPETRAACLLGIYVLLDVPR